MALYLARFLSVQPPQPKRITKGCRVPASFPPWLGLSSETKKKGRTVSPGVRGQGWGEWPIQSQHRSGCRQGSTWCQALAPASPCTSGSHGAPSCPLFQLPFRLLGRPCRVTGKTHMRAPFFGDSKPQPKWEKRINTSLSFHLLTQGSVNHKPQAKFDLWSVFPWHLS